MAIIAVDGRRWVWAPWGDVHWVRNLRAAGGATITVRGRDEDVTATELDQAERLAFFRDVLGPVARTLPFGRRFIRIVDGVDLDDPVDASVGRPSSSSTPCDDRPGSRAATLVLARLQDERGGWLTPAGSPATRNLSVHSWCPPGSPEIGASNL